MYSGNQARLEAHLEAAHRAVWRAQLTASAMDRYELADDLQAIAECITDFAGKQLGGSNGQGQGVTRSTGGRVRRVV